MASTNRDSTDYNTIHTLKRGGLVATKRGGRLFPIPFQHTVVFGETGGASAGVQDTVNLCVIPANAMVVGLHLSAQNIWASAGVNGTFELGDSGSSNRYVAATESYSTDGPIATEKVYVGLTFTGQNYIPTVDTIVVLTWKVANPTVGKILKGVILVLLPE